jgi:hypothetical protein
MTGGELEAREERPGRKPLLLWRHPRFGLVTPKLYRLLLKAEKVT